MPMRTSEIRRISFLKRFSLHSVTPSKPVKLSDIGPLLSGYNLFLQSIDNDAVDFKISAKNVLKIRNENSTTYEDVAL